ncbi:MAG: protein kinase [Polyangiaceae bacterium]
MSSLRLGPFALDHEVGRGGMGQVWRARRGDGDTPVAVKVLFASGRPERFLESFKREVRAMARLDHPGIVDVYDYGLVSEEESLASGGHLVSGSPYLAMSWVDGGTLGQLVQREEQRFDWPRLRDALLQILDALAHAHARGVIHRDLKPDNVLVMRDDEHGPRFRLADFGIAHAGSEEEATFLAGTPIYMSPEQFANEEASFGPWTDLYALGCMAFELASGRPPFGSDNLLQLTLAHAEEPPPPLAPRMALPRGFEGWLRALLHKSIAARPQRAADAAYALARLGPEMRPAAPRSRSGGDPEAATIVRATTTLTPLVTLAPRTEGSPTIGPPPIPPRWETPGRERRRWLEGIGMSLLGVRDQPLIGRDELRGELWSRLSEVKRRGAPELVLLRGTAGIGKSRLARWLLERAEELGAALGLSASFASGPRGGFESMLRRLVLSGDLTGDALRDRLTRRLVEPGGPLRADEAARLAELLEGADLEVEQMGNLLTRLLRHEAGGRAVVLWLDDLQASIDGAALAQHLLDHGAKDGPFPVLVLATLRDDGDATPIADELAHHPATVSHRLQALSEPESATLMRSLLGLDRGLADRLAHRTHGHPLFAIQLLEDWARRGLLEPRPHGYVLAAGTDITVPDGLHQIWSDRIARLLEGRARGDREALEIAATIGVAIDPEVWRDACRHAAIRPTPSLTDDLVEAGFLAPDRGGLRFVHGMLVESILRLAHEGGRLPQHHAAAAAALRPRWRARGEARLAAALGRHLVAAGKHVESLAPLLAGADAMVRRGALIAAEQLLEERRAALDAIGASAVDDDRLAGEVLAARSASIRARHQEAESRIAAVLAESPSAALRARATLEAAEIAERAGQRREGHERFAEARRLLSALGDRRGTGRAATGQGTMAAYLGDIEAAVELCQRAIEELTGIDEPLLLGRAERALGNLHLLRAETEDARQRYDAALARFVAVDAEHDIHKTLNGLAESYRLAGRLEIAIEAFEVLLDRQRRMVATSDLDLTQFNLGLTLIALRRFEEAAWRLGEVEAGLVERPNEVLHTGLAFAWLPCVAHAGDPAEIERRLARAQGEASRGEGLMEHDDAVNARFAGELLEAKAPELARACYLLARDHWRAHGATEAADDVEQRLAALNLAGQGPREP